jgi:transposase
MRASRLSINQLKSIHRLYVSGEINLMQDAIKLGIARNTLKRHWRLLDQLSLTRPQRITDSLYCLNYFKKPQNLSPMALQLQQLLPNLINTRNGKQNVKSIWQIYLKDQSEGYRYSQFAYRYAEWALKNIGAINPQISKLIIADEDRQLLQQWRRSSDRRKWEKAVVLLDTAAGKPITVIADKIERTPEKVRCWLNGYQQTGINGLLQRTRGARPEIAEQITAKKENLIRLIHEAPQLHGFNRTSWRLADLSIAFKQIYGMPLSIPTISSYLRKEGYVFRKARKVLTSPDPDFREKLTHIQYILGNLGPKEKFFSIDEYGPFSIKIKGGTSYVKQGQTKTYPQHQQSKGCLICTAALELSTNQVIHFYSPKKNTEEMIKLLEMLLIRYYDQEKLYFSWDAAAWHASKKLKEKLDIINTPEYRAQHRTPLVELAPLPASAQFLNVIESVFSGLARSVIHHSDYPSVGHCKAAIDQHFKDRNRHFALHPKKAGKKIWGQERTVAEFRDSHNCKDPTWR